MAVAVAVFNVAVGHCRSRPGHANDARLAIGFCNMRNCACPVAAARQLAMTPCVIEAADPQCVASQQSLHHRWYDVYGANPTTRAEPAGPWCN